MRELITLISYVSCLLQIVRARAILNDVPIAGGRWTKNNERRRRTHEAYSALAEKWIPYGLRRFRGRGLFVVSKRANSHRHGEVIF